MKVELERMLLKQGPSPQLNLHSSLHINLLLKHLDLSLHPHNQLIELQLHKLPPRPIGTLHLANQLFMYLERHEILDHHHLRYCSVYLYNFYFSYTIHWLDCGLHFVSYKWCCWGNGVAIVASVASQRNGGGTTMSTRGNGSISRASKFQPVGGKDKISWQKSFNQ